MWRALLLALAAIVAAQPAGAFLLQGGSAPVTTQQLISGSDAAVSHLSDRYLPIGIIGNTTHTADWASGLFPVAGTITSIRVYTVTAPASGKVWTVTPWKAGVAQTAAACTVSSTDPTSNAGTGAMHQCVLGVNSVHYTAGQAGSLQIHTTGTVDSFISATLVFQPDNANDAIVLGMGQSWSQTATWAARPFYFGGVSTTGAQVQSIVPDAGTIDRLYVSALSAPGATSSSKNIQFTVNKGTTPQALTTPLFETATTNNDLSNSFNVAAPSGATVDTLSVQAAPTGTPTISDTSFGFRYVPTTAGAYPLISGGGNVDVAGSTLFYPLTGGPIIGSTTEGNQQSISEAMTIMRMAVKSSIAPGSTKNRVIKLRVNGVDTTCVVTLANQIANSVTCPTPVAVAAGDLVGYSDTLDTGGTAGASSISALAHQ